MRVAKYLPDDGSILAFGQGIIVLIGWLWTVWIIWDSFHIG